MECPTCGWKGARLTGSVSDIVKSYQCTAKSCGYEWDADDNDLMAEENKALEQLVQSKSNAPRGVAKVLRETAKRLEAMSE